jgi:predicted nucleic acid-binding protein
LITPLPIVFEVYKWLVYEAGPATAQQGLRHMTRSLDLAYPMQDEFVAAATLAGALRGWGGTLEDALVAVTALGRRVPVWTMNFRDLGAIPELHFWNPR